MKITIEHEGAQSGDYYFELDDTPSCMILSVIVNIHDDQTTILAKSEVSNKKGVQRVRQGTRIGEVSTIVDVEKSSPLEHTETRWTMKKIAEKIPLTTLSNEEAQKVLKMLLEVPSV